MNLAVVIAIIIAISIPVAGGVLSGFFGMPRDRKWYANLKKPAWNPPSWIFGPAWTVLYILMGLASYFVWKNRTSPWAKIALAVYAIQLLVNFAWTPTFFRFHRLDIALGLIATLWALIAALLVLFWKVSVPAFWLIVPYFAWVSFAATLNGYIAFKN